MSVYVDDMRAAFGNMVMCHMIADSTPELLTMADHISVARRWIQRAGTPGEHFDICMSKRVKAIAAGAIEITQRTLGMMIRDRRNAAQAAHREAEHRITQLTRERDEALANIAEIKRAWGNWCRLSGWHDPDGFEELADTITSVSADADALRDSRGEQEGDAWPCTPKIARTSKAEHSPQVGHRLKGHTP